MSEVKIIGITGGSGCGKSTIVRKISETTGNFAYIAQDNYYKSASFVNNSNITAYNFDRPEAFDSDLLYKQLLDLKNGKGIDMPQYDFSKHCRKEETVHVDSAPLIVVEGLMVLCYPEIRKLMDLKIYVDTPDDIRFIRRLQRDISERGRTMDSVIKQYLEVVRPGHIEYIEPTKNYADIIIPEGGHNKKAMDVLICFVRDVISEKE